MRNNFKSSRTKVILIFFSIFLMSAIGYIVNQRFSADTFTEQPTLPSIVLPVNNERFVYMNTPLIQGVIRAGTVVEIKDNDSVIGTATSEADGRFYYKPTAGFADGIHIVVARNTVTNESSAPTYINFDMSDSSRAILKAKDTNIIENDHKYYGNGTNYFMTIMDIQTRPEVINAEFDNMEKAGIKMVRVINYMLRDMKLPDPITAPTPVVGDDGNMALTPGQGYWLNVDDTNKISTLKYPLTERSSTTIGVTKGWNLLGNPYQTDLPLSNLQVKYKDGTTRSYQDAIARKEVSGYA